MVDLAFELRADERRPGVEPIKTIVDDWDEPTFI
jgi:hypothetical protein